ncbi:MAG TPA: radical SAM protein, partial [Baekduia sp.]|nr:radical SAM protein [Baekduia sp.]
LREVTASQGLMLESLRSDLVAHQGSPTKDPELRLQTIRWAGELKIPFTSGILVGIGETRQDRTEALTALAEVHAEYGHLQEVILQNFVPHRKYYGEEPADIATEAAERFWRTGLRDVPIAGVPDWASAVSLEDLIDVIGVARELMPDVGIQVPPNLSEHWPELVAAGATDLGGLSANGDHISPEHPFPSPHQVRKRLAQDGVALTERLCVYGKYLDPEWVEQHVLDVVKVKYWSFIPRRGSGRADAPFAIQSDLVGPATARARDGEVLSIEELTAMFASTDAGAIEEMRAAADEVRRELAGDVVTFVVNRNINVSNVCVVGCAFCGFGQGRRSPDAYQLDEQEFRSRVREAVDYGATELCMQSGIHPDWQLDDYLYWLRVAKDEAPQLHLHAYSPMEIAHMQDISGLGLDIIFERLRGVGLGSTPGTAAEVLHSASASAPTSCRSRAGSRSSRPATAPGCARPRR